MAKRQKQKTQPPILPDWQINILLDALSDHQLVLTRLRQQPPASAYHHLVDMVRENLKAMKESSHG